MSVRQPRYSHEEYSGRGELIYRRDIKHLVEPDNMDKVVAIDIESGEFALGDNAIQASKPLFDRNDDAQIWFVRVGHQVMCNIGGRALVDHQ